jgi:hypothetical protein
MPFPRGFIRPCSKAERLVDCQLQDVETIDTVQQSHEYSPVFIIDFQKSMLDVDATATLELSKALNVGLEARNDVDTSESPVLTALANEEYGVAHFDLNDLPITKFD